MTEYGSSDNLNDRLKDENHLTTSTGLGISLTILLFTILGVFAFMGARKNARALREFEGDYESVGWEMRKWFYYLLFGGMFGRLLAFLMDLLQDVFFPDSILGYWIVSVIHWMPSFVFASMYSLLISFMGTICYACRGITSLWLRKLYFGINAMLYAVFLIILVLQVSLHGPKEHNYDAFFWRSCAFVLGCFYAINLVGLVYFGGHVISYFRADSVEDDVLYDFNNEQTSFRGFSPRYIVLMRIMVVSVVCSLLFLSQAIYLVGSGLAWIPTREGAIVKLGRNPDVFYVVYFTVTEALPSMVILWLTRRFDDDDDAKNKNKKKNKNNLCNIHLRNSHSSTSDNSSSMGSNLCRHNFQASPSLVSTTSVTTSLYKDKTFIQRNRLHPPSLQDQEQERVRNQQQQQQKQKQQQKQQLQQHQRSSSSSDMRYDDTYDRDCNISNNHKNEELGTNSNHWINTWWINAWKWSSRNQSSPRKKTNSATRGVGQPTSSYQTFGWGNQSQHNNAMGITAATDATDASVAATAELDHRRGEKELNEWA